MGFTMSFRFFICKGTVVGLYDKSATKGISFKCERDVYYDDLDISDRSGGNIVFKLPPNDSEWNELVVDERNVVTMYN